MVDQEIKIFRIINNLVNSRKIVARFSLWRYLRLEFARQQFNYTQGILGN